MERIRIKDSVEIFEKENGNYVFFFTGSRKAQEFKVDNLIIDIVKELDRDIKKSELIEKLSINHPTHKINSAIGALEGIQVLRSYNESNIDEKFKRQYSFVDEFTSSSRETEKVLNDLRNKKVSIFGVGGIGSWVSNGLSQMGIGSLVLCDPGKVSYSNLNRQLFFRTEDVGKYKVDVVSSSLEDTKTETYKTMVSDKNSLDELVSSSDLIINCADNPDVYSTSKILDSYSQKYNIPLCIGGGYNMHNGMVGPILIPNKTASLGDFVANQKKGDFFKGLNPIRYSSQTGSLSSITGTVANIQCMEIFKHLTGVGTPNYNKFAEINFLNSKVKWIDFSKK